MRIENRNSDDLVLEELGRRVAHTRLERNLSQAELAKEAGVAKTTLERMETGGPVRTSSLVRILRALGMLEVLDKLIPEPLPSPIERRRLEGRRRRRAGGTRTSRPSRRAALALGRRSRRRRMSEVADVRLWGRTIGAVLLEDGEEPRSSSTARSSRLAESSSRR